MGTAAEAAGDAAPGFGEVGSLPPGVVFPGDEVPPAATAAVLLASYLKIFTMMYQPVVVISFHVPCWSESTGQIDDETLNNLQISVGRHSTLRSFSCKAQTDQDFIPVCSRVT